MRTAGRGSHIGKQVREKFPPVEEPWPALGVAELGSTALSSISSSITGNPAGRR